MTAAVLAGLAVLVLLHRARPQTSGTPPRRDLAALVLAVALALLVGGAPGLVLGGATAVLGPRLLARLEDGSDDAEVLAVLPLALDLLGACLAGGAPPAEAVRAVAVAFPGPCGDRLERVAAGLALGTLPREAWSALGSGPDAAGAAARALARAAEGGAPVAGAVQRVAADARRRHRADAHRKASRAGVLAVLPLGACFLPAFVLLGVVPAVIGLAGPLLHSLG